MRIQSTSAILGFAALLLGGASFAQANLIVNPGFETGDLTGWLPLGAGAGATITVETPDNGPSASGIFNADELNTLPAANLALQQTTPSTSVGSNVLVDYSFDLKGGVSANGGVEFVHIFDQDATGAVIGQGPGLLGPYFVSDTSWQTFTGSFTTAPGTDHLTIEFDATTGAATGSEEQMHVDNVVLGSASVPEPMSLSLVAMSSVFLLRRRGRKI